ncbi:MAG: YceI family protein, partial [Eudoraea sp.]|nr:YceI family protein [Eudoraea sp.]
MKKHLFILFIAWGCQSLAQTTFRTETGEIQFDASTPLEDIYAINSKVNFALTAEGEIAVLLLVKEFDFKRKLMQEHFNENYIESDKYP